MKRRAKCTLKSPLSGGFAIAIVTWLVVIVPLQPIGAMSHSTSNREHVPNDYNKKAEALTKRQSAGDVNAANYDASHKYVPKPSPPSKRSKSTDMPDQEEAMRIIEAYSDDDERQHQQNEDLDFAGQHSAEYSLYQRLLGSSRYQKHVRPVRDHHQPIKVKVGMCVMMIEEIIERDQIMTMAACIKMKWTDDFLVWKPENYDNLTWLAISSTNIWLPDIAIINSPEPYELTRKSTNVDVDFRGEVGFFPSGRLATRCNLQITYFPFDWQHCEVRLESWIYPTQYLEIEMYPDDTVDLKEYYTNHQWAVAGYRVLPEVADYDGKNFSSITFTFILRRKSEYYFMYFIFPQLLLALLQTLSHTLPVEHPGRMAMLTSLFIGTSVTQAGVAVHIPKSSDSMSLLQIYMTIMSCNLVLALVVTFVMMYAVLRYPNEEPSFVAMLVAFFSIVWPSDANKLGHNHHHHNPAPVYQRRQSVAVNNRRSSSPYVVDRSTYITQTSTSQQPKQHRKTKDRSSSREDRDRKSQSRSRKQGQIVNSTGYQDHTMMAKPRHHNNHAQQQQMSPSSQPSGDMTSFRKIVARQSLSPQNRQNYNNGNNNKRLTFAPDLYNDDYNSDDNDYEDYADATIVHNRNQQQQPLKKHAHANGSVPQRSKHQTTKRGMAVTIDTSPDVMLGFSADFSPMNPNTPMLSMMESGRSGGASLRNGKLPISSATDASNKNSAAESSDGGVNNAKENNSVIVVRRPVQRSRSNRGEAAPVDDTRELKRRWLLYCVALDKTIMYAQLVWNIIVPLLLFAIVPVLSPHPFLHVTNDP